MLWDRQCLEDSEHNIHILLKKILNYLIISFTGLAMYSGWLANRCILRRGRVSTGGSVVKWLPNLFSTLLLFHISSQIQVR